MRYLKNYALIFVMGMAVIISGATLMVVSQRVYETQRSIKQLNQEALMTEWEIRSLNAELAYLTSPERLEQITTAMTQSISPVASATPIIFPSTSLVSYKAPDYSSVRPLRKPASYTPQKPQIQKSPSKSYGDFSILLNQVGGRE